MSFFQSHIKTFFAVLFIGLSVAFAFNSSAQTTEESAASQTVQEAPVQTLETQPDAGTSLEFVQTQTEKGSPPVINLDDPAILAALDAREQADRALADAVRAQQEALTQTAPQSSEKLSGNKKKIIPSNADEIKVLGQKIADKLIGWLTSIPFLAQIGALVLTYFLAPIIASLIRKRVFLFSAAPSEDTKLKVIRDIIYRGRTLLRPILLVGFLALFALILKNIPIAGQDWLVKIVQGLAVVFLLFSAIKEFAPNDLIQKLATWTLIPIALLMVFGYYDNLLGLLNSTELMAIGGTPITAMTVILLVIFGALFFKVGNIVNTRGQDAIRSQETLDVSTREVVAKIFQIILFTVIFILVLGAAKVPLSGLVVIFSALSLGIGLGLQPIAANFVSGLIILFDRSVQVGDYVVLPEGQEGFVEAINMRSTTVETTDGKDIMVPNTVWTESAYENWTHKDPRQRYEVYFTVSYDTDLDALEGILIPAICEHPSVLQEPEEPDLELREFGENGVKFAIEFWCSGIDDGPNKFTSDLNFIVWRTLKANKIQIPFPQRVVKMIK